MHLAPLSITDNRKTITVNRYFSFSISNALLSWSGHEVGLLPQRMPFVIAITSSMWRPCARRATPTVLPGQPPTNSTFRMMLLSSAVMLMQREHVPVVVYWISFILFCFFYGAYMPYRAYGPYGPYWTNAVNRKPSPSLTGVSVPRETGEPKGVQRPLSRGGALKFSSPVVEADFLQFMVAHEAAFVNVAVDAT